MPRKRCAKKALFITVWAGPEATETPCLMVISLLAGHEAPRGQALKRLEARFGPCFYLSRPLPFTDTSYYAAEMGDKLTRRLAVFSNLQPGSRLAVIKRQCLSLERDFAAHGRRAVNIDPGLLSQGAFILASLKPAAHRLALSRGVYGELTLLFNNGVYSPLPWTYPDYAGYCDLMLAWRNRYLWLLRQQKGEL